MKRNTRPKLDKESTATDSPSGIVADGYDRLVSAVESDARRIVEAKYADEWNASGMLRRWKLQRQMDTETAAIVAATMPDVSPDALF
ncbi:hypothetical protein Poly51_63300 [Rubripirellula tenax]|uniref:Uncharacterized protein n=1 Tax=Rubripirellula tenax TaxID=2528015 RepID=A0A5C6E430_9BACT|nr:hypothetical protein [Rubripirellula tenax]TWU43570.1 hypothetical protein Poly51_63300 [Rubripirellula tenax]